MKKTQYLSFLATVAIAVGMISWGSALHAQTSPSTPSSQSQQTPSSPDTAPSQQTPQTQPTPSPEMPPASQQTPKATAPGSQTPDASAPESGAKTGSAASAAAPGESQTFSGTVVKQGDKYMLKDDSGKTYDIDHQSDVAKFEGKRVRVQGTLDSNGKILVK